VHWKMNRTVVLKRVILYSSCPGSSNMSKMMTTVEMIPHSLCWFCFES
jgi:hypothetical protein